MFVPSLLFGQDYSYANYDSKDGLAGSTVYCAVQDKDGFMWFGTETGLSRFDGTHFKNFTTADGLPDNEILGLFADSKNRVWMLPFKNSICYYQKGQVYNQENDSVLKKLSINGVIKKVVEDKYGNILLLSTYSYYIIKKDGEVINENKIHDSLFVSADAGINKNGEFSLLAGLINGGNYIFDFYGTQPVFRQVAAYNRFIEGKGGLLSPGFTILRDLKMLHFYPSAVKSFSIPVPKNFINIVQLNDTLLAINAVDKCLFFDLSLGKIIHEFLPGHKVSNVLQDREKNFWFTTLGDGVFRLGSVDFRNVRFPREQGFLSAHSLLSTPSGVYVGTDNALLWKFNRLTHHLSKFEIGASLQQGRVTSLLQQGQQLFVGTDVGLYIYSKDLKMISALPGSIKGMAVYNNSVVVAEAEGVSKIGEQGDTMRVSGNRATCIFPTGKSFYVGTLNGLYELDSLCPCYLDRNPPFLGKNNKLLRSRIYAITKGENGIFWIATYGEGVIGYKNNRIVANLREENGLTSNMCRTIIASGADLWVGTDKGLNKVHWEDGKYGITKFTTADGLSSDIVNAICVDSRIVYVATPRGLTYFDEKGVSQFSNCILHLTEISVSNQSWLYDTTDLHLRKRDNNIRFEFAGISYRSGGDIVYQYRLLGLDSNWKTSRENFLSYPSLPSGNYELQLVAINKFGIQSEVKRIRFTIEKLLIEKTWFRILLAAAAIGIIFFLVSLYLKGTHKKEQEKSNTLRKMAELEQMALRAQMNPHFIFNSLNSIQQYVMDKDIAGANKFITDFSRLIRQTLEFSTMQEISVMEEISYLTTYLELEQTRMENKFTYEIKLCDKVSVGEYHLPPMILQPFVENSIRHGLSYRKDRGGRLAITVSEENECLVCVVEDNGVGRDVAGQYRKASAHYHQSKGMSVTMGRLDMLNQNSEHKITVAVDDLKNEEGMALGTRVVICFPVHQHNKY